MDIIYGALHLYIQINKHICIYVYMYIFILLLCTCGPKTFSLLRSLVACSMVPIPGSCSKRRCRRQPVAGATLSCRRSRNASVGTRRCSLHGANTQKMLVDANTRKYMKTRNIYMGIYEIIHLEYIYGYHIRRFASIHTNT